VYGKNTIVALLIVPMVAQNGKICNGANAIDARHGTIGGETLIARTETTKRRGKQEKLTFLETRL
jgi:hypothetical protein